MRVSTQIVLGYAMAVAATVAVAVIAWSQVRAIEKDIEEVGEEWQELDAVTSILASIRQARDGGPRTHLREDEATLARMVEEGPAAPDNAHDTREREIWTRLLALAREAQAADALTLARIENEAEILALRFWQEDRGRVPRHVQKLEERQARLRSVNIAAAGGILLLPLVFLLYLQLRIARPLARIQKRVEAIGRLTPAAAAHGGLRMDRLADAIAAMAESVEARQKSLTEQLQHADRLGGLGRIAAAVAHELNTPLGSIGLCLEGIRDEPGNAAQYLKTAEEQIEACTATTRKLLTYARLRPSAPQEMGATALAREAVGLVESHMRKNAVRVEVEGVPGEEEAVKGDASQLRQAIVNLLLNAIDASPRGGTVRVRVVAGKGAVEIAVDDEGPGVPEVMREEIFNPFFTTKRPGEGTGLGLSIAREIAESHGGTLTLGAGARGASFRIRLPSARMVQA
ncbi:MAG TPA: HAMP domain-containing sensor histidine kinase [Planctomycetota bacterium]|nr:HAMP domain-containing sensor histidine kinase [Planctomycetota bacterium]